MDTQDTATARYAAVGLRFRGAYLIQQAGYTLELAARVGKALTDKIPPNFLEHTAALCEQLGQAMQDKTVRVAEARRATATQNQLQRDGKIWVRVVGKRCRSGMELGVHLPSELGKLSSPPSAPGLLEQMTKTLGLLARHAADMEKVGMPVQTNIAEGQKIFQALQLAESIQERTRASDMPAAVTAFNAKKGELYGALKIINNAGHELYANDPAGASKFNMSILHRRPAKPSEPVSPVPASPHST